MSRLDNALRNLGRATLLQDETLRLRAINELLHLAGVGSDVLNGSPPQSPLFRPLPKSKAPDVMWGKHSDVDGVGRIGKNLRGTINGRGAQLYYSNGYYSIARELHRAGRCDWRPSKGPGGRAAVWLTDDEAAVVRAEHASRYSEVRA